MNARLWAVNEWGKWALRKQSSHPPSPRGRFEARQFWRFYNYLNILFVLGLVLTVISSPLEKVKGD
jgi:hypothetical protein